MCRTILIGYVSIPLSNSLFSGLWTDTAQEMFDNQLRPQDITDQTWPDLMEDFTTGNDDYYSV
jgi:hypothetical protein